MTTVEHDAELCHGQPTTQAGERWTPPEERPLRGVRRRGEAPEAAHDAAEELPHAPDPSRAHRLSVYDTAVNALLELATVLDKFSNFHNSSTRVRLLAAANLRDPLILDRAIGIVDYIEGTPLPHRLELVRAAVSLAALIDEVVLELRTRKVTPPPVAGVRWEGQLVPYVVTGLDSPCRARVRLRNDGRVDLERAETSMGVGGDIVTWVPLGPHEVVPMTLVRALAGLPHDHVPT